MKDIFIVVCTNRLTSPENQEPKSQNKGKNR